MIKSIIFDLGGVYFTNGKDAAIKKISRKYNISPEIANKFLFTGSELGGLYRKGLITSEEFWDRSKNLSGIKADNDELNKLWVESYKPIKGTVRIIKLLKKKRIKLYVLSDNVKERVEYLQSKYKFMDNFVDGIFSNDIHITKNEGTGAFKLILEKTRENPENVLFIDDIEKYVETARELGMNGICFKSPEQLEEEFKNLGIL